MSSNCRMPYAAGLKRKQKLYMSKAVPLSITAREQARMDKLKAEAVRTEKAYFAARENGLAVRLAMAVKYGPKQRVPVELEEEEA